MNKYVTELIERYQNLAPLAQPVEQAIDAITDCYRKGGKVMLCGNGGSAAQRIDLLCENKLGVDVVAKGRYKRAGLAKGYCRKTLLQL